MFVPTSRKFYDEFTGTGGAGVTYLNALQGDKITCVLEGYFFWAMENSKLTFTAADKTISLFYSPSSQASATSFITQGFNIGDTIEVVGTASNDGTYTISELSDRVITVIEVIVDETANNASIYGTTLVTDIDFLYDLIPNNSSKADFISATDKNTIQKYSATGLDAAIATPVDLTIATESYGWVTDIVAGISGEGFVEGEGITDYKQKFKITTVFYMTRIWTKELMNNFISRTAPDEYTKGNHLKHVCQVVGKFDLYEPIINHTGSLFKQLGQSGWYNQSNAQALPEYRLNSIQYQNFATTEYLEQIDGSIVNLVTMSIYSRSGKFVAGTTKFILNHFLCPIDEAEYVDTSTTLLQNIRLDKKIITMDAAVVNGINFGTDYQALTQIQATYVDANNVLITFRVDYSSVTKTILANKSDDDRLYAFAVSCQDIAITTTKNTDRVNIIADFNAMDYDQRESANLELVDYIHCFVFPNYGVFEVNNITGYQGDPSYVEIPFRLETAVINGVSPTLDNVQVQIVATKADNADFVLEEKIFETSQVRKLDDKQTINIEDARGFIFADGSPFNRSDLVRDSDNDSGTKIGVTLRYAFALRYEEWLNVIQSSDEASIDVYKDIEEVVQAWKRYSTGNGWALQLRMTAQVKGYNGSTTMFHTETSFTIKENGDAPDAGVAFKGLLKYYNEDGVEVPGIMTDVPTRIVARFGGDPTVFPSGMTVLNGYLFADNEGGSIFTRRLASTDFDSETNSPFTTTDLPVLNGAVSEVVSANLRLTEFANRVELDAWYVPDENNPGNKQVTARLGNNVANILLKEDGSAILQEDGSYILL